MSPEVIPASLLTNVEEAYRYLHKEIFHGVTEPPAALSRSLRRALDAGAVAPLTFLGMGGYGAVYCDDGGVAWKVDYHDEKAMMTIWKDREGEAYRCFGHGLREEFEYLATARQIPAIADHIIPVHAWYPEQFAMQRKCIWGTPGTPLQDKVLRELHQHIADATFSFGWTAPEFKEDAFVLEDETRRWILVDGGQAYRIGQNLVGYIEDVLEGRRPQCDRWRDYAYYLMQELDVHNGLPAAEVVKNIERLLPYVTEPTDLRDVNAWLRRAKEKRK